jgi:hypothetical protein
MEDQQSRKLPLSHERICRDIRKSVHIYNLVLSLPIILSAFLAAVMTFLSDHDHYKSTIAAILWVLVLLLAFFTALLLVSNARNLLAVKSRKYVITEDILTDKETITHRRRSFRGSWHRLSFGHSGVHRVRSDIFAEHLDLTVENTYYLVGIPRKNGRLRLLYIYDTQSYQQDQA